MIDQTGTERTDKGDSEVVGGPAALKFDLKHIVVTIPTPDELYTACRPIYERDSPTFLDRWPDHLKALSFPTKLIPFDGDQFCQLWGHDEEALAAADKIAAVLDGHMGWNNWFVRLNSRSPKDSAYPGLPVTCSGKQAVSWIMSSERCLDDATMLRSARAPLFVCLREYHLMHKAGEFRCFAKDGDVLGVTRYFYDEPPPADMNPDGVKIMAAARKFFVDHLAAEYPTVVFDLYAPGGNLEKLIEINPYGKSDPCLFAGYDDIEANGGFRWVAQTPPQSGAQPAKPTSEAADPQDFKSGLNHIVDADQMVPPPPGREREI